MSFAIDALLGAASVLASGFLLAFFVLAFRNPDRSSALDMFGPVELASVTVTCLFAFGWGFILKAALAGGSTMAAIEALAVAVATIAGLAVIWRMMGVKARVSAFEVEASRRTLSLVAEGSPPPRTPTKPVGTRSGGMRKAA